LLLLGGSKARAQAPRQIDIPAEPLADALGALARMIDTGLLFDAQIVAGIQSPALHGRLTPDQALQRLLHGSGVQFVRMASGAILLRRTMHPPPVEALPDEPGGQAAIPEILVIGHHALNVDLVRGEDDIQPYKVFTAEDIARSGSDSADEFLKTRLADNTQALLTTQSPVANFGATRSLIDLHGLGNDQTLVLVDGHRLPSYPALDAFDQSNINGIPLNAIARVEILPSTAGGIYGPGATGGVVNVILKHDANGIDIGGSTGITQRGDDPTLRLQLHAGFTSPGGGTRADIFLEHSSEAGLRVGQRNFEQQAQTAQFNNLNTQPAATNFPYYESFPAPYSSSINIISNQPIYLSSPLGGGSIGSNYTFIPLADVGTPQEAAILHANAGKLDFSLPDTGYGTRQSLLTRTERDGGVLTLRQRISDRVDGFLDVVASRERGTAIGGEEYQSPYGDLFTGFGDSPVVSNPDEGPSSIRASFPPIANTGSYVTTSTLIQATGGLIAALGRGWQAEADMTWGRVASNTSSPEEAGPYLVPNVFGGAAGLAAFAQSLQPWPYVHQHSADRLLDGSVRLAGSVLRLPAGRLTVTLQGEWRSDQTDGIRYSVDRATVYQYPTALFLPPDSAGQTLDDKSAYAELRAPLIDRDSRIMPLRGFELQVALRGDLTRIVVPQGAETLTEAVFAPFYEESGVVSQVRERYATMAYTLGAKSEPLPFLTLRASYATGYQPPDAGALALAGLDNNNAGFTDPRRNSESLAQEGNPSIDLDGATNLRPSRYQSLVIGAILHTQGTNPVRLSIDFNRLHASNQVFAFPNLGGIVDNFGPQYLLDNERLFSGRITRTPLTAADIAAGYSAGAVTHIDNSAASTAATQENSIDFDLRYALHTAVGEFRLATAFTWILGFRQRTAPDQPWYSALGTIDGPSPWKGNVALGWSKGEVSLDTNLQLFSPYHLYPAQDVIGGAVDIYSASEAVELPAEAGRTTIPVQAYLDAAITWKIRNIGRHAATIRLSCQDVLDTFPPPYVPKLIDIYFSGFTLGYSYFGDPRGRRFTLGINVAL
jgi:iron complex outermembrane receptor protein